GVESTVRLDPESPAVDSQPAPRLRPAHDPGDSSVPRTTECSTGESCDRPRLERTAAVDRHRLTAISPSPEVHLGTKQAMKVRPPRRTGAEDRGGRPASPARWPSMPQGQAMRAEATSLSVSLRHLASNS